MRSENSRRQQSRSLFSQFSQPTQRQKQDAKRHLIAAVAAVCMTAPALATSDVWDGSTNNSWSINTNWQTDPGTVPGAGETATFSLDAATVNNNTTIDLGAAGITIGSVVYDTSSAAGYTIGAGALGSQTITFNTPGN